MHKKKYNFVIVLIVEMFLLILQLILLMSAVHRIQGNGRIVNYAGLVRGATQRLVKNEFYGIHDDSKISELDNILLGLQTGNGNYNLNVMKDDDYNLKLALLADKWLVVKNAIFEFRNDQKKIDYLYDVSEDYFISADVVVDAAEDYSDGIAKRLRILEITISVTILLMLCLLGWQIVNEVHRNRILNKIAYIDPHTGLPNKRCCEDKMSEYNTALSNEIVEGSNDSKEGDICCLLFDLNDLKRANDTFGHLVGDVLISSFASLLRQAMPDDMFIGRFGGDEFIGIQLNGDEKEIKKCIESLKVTAGQTNVGNTKQKIIISFAYGYAFSSKYPGKSVKDLMDIADKNMYQNKMEMKRNLHKI